MKPSDILAGKRDAIRDMILATRFARNPRLFGSVAHGEDRPDSDVDILVDVTPDATLFDLGGLQEQLQDALGLPVDLLTPGDIGPALRARILSDCVAL